jgi:hypothetical protein
MATDNRGYEKDGFNPTRAINLSEPALVVELNKNY